jgi:hypothetical protein
MITKVAAHTPGPWSDDWIIRGPSHIDGHRANGEPTSSLRRVIAHVIDRDEESAANARLIAAAPEMLEALESLPLNAFGEDMGNCDAADFVDHSGEFFEAMIKARAAIRKAKGE